MIGGALNEKNKNLVHNEMKVKVVTIKFVQNKTFNVLQSPDLKSKILLVTKVCF